MTTHDDDHPTAEADRTRPRGGRRLRARGDAIAELFGLAPRPTTARGGAADIFDPDHPGDRDTSGAGDLRRYLAAALARLHRRFDVLEQQAAEQMFLQLRTRDVVLGERREFSPASRAVMIATVAAPPYAGRCPCCTSAAVLDPAGRPRRGVEFDHAFHRALHRPEHGWLICPRCHGEFNAGGYLLRHARMPEFRRHQAMVLARLVRLPVRRPAPVRRTHPPLDLMAD